MSSPTIAGNLTSAAAGDVRGTKHHSNNNFNPNRLFICQRSLKSQEISFLDRRRCPSGNWRFVGYSILFSTYNYGWDILFFGRYEHFVYKAEMIDGYREYLRWSQV